MRKLPFYDAVLAVTDVAINKGLQRMFAAASDEISLELDPEHDVRLTAKIGTPTITFLSSDRAKITVPIVEGTYQGAKKWNAKKKQLEEDSRSLAGSSLGFTVDVAKAHDERAVIHEQDFTIQKLYLDLTQVRAIDTTEFAVSIEDQEHVGEVVNAFIEALQTSQAAPGGDGRAPARLTLGHVIVPAVVDPTGSPFLPSHGTFSVTLQDSEGHSDHVAVGREARRVDEEGLPEERAPKPRQPASPGDLNFLLMMGGRGLPADRGAGHFDTPWTPRTTAEGKPAHDGVLVISDYLLLDAITAPLLKSLAVPADKITINRGDGSTPTRVTLTKAHDLKDGVRLGRFEAAVDESGKIVLVLRAEKSEPLHDLFNKPFTMVVFQERTIALQIESSDKGDLSLRVVSDTTTEPKSILTTDHEPTVADYLALIADLALTHGALLMQALIPLLSDKDQVIKQLGEFTTALQADVNHAVQLPGGAVFSFGKPRVEGRLLKYDADYIELPALERPKHKPFQIGKFPRMGPEGKETSDRTEPVQVGEAMVSYRMVDDPDYGGRQAQDSPYYILRRDQYWSRLYRRGWPPHEEVTDTKSWRVAMSKEQSESMEKATHMRVTAGCRLAFKDFISAEMQTEIGNELRMDVETTTREEKEATHQLTITHQASDTAYTVALWTIVDRFTLCRRDRYPIKTWDYVHGEDHVEVDYSAGEAPKLTPAPTLTDPTKELVGAGAGGAS